MNAFSYMKKNSLSDVFSVVVIQKEKRSTPLKPGTGHRPSVAQLSSTNKAHSRSNHSFASPQRMKHGHQCREFLQLQCLCLEVVTVWALISVLEEDIQSN